MTAGVTSWKFTWPFFFSIAKDLCDFQVFRGIIGGCHLDSYHDVSTDPRGKQKKIVDNQFFIDEYFDNWQRQNLNFLFSHK